jgi:hypothetical protein
MPRLSNNPETRSVQIGVLGTLLVHLLLFLFVPYLLRTEPIALHRRPAEQQFNVELAPEAPPPAPAPKPLPSKFVEVNPDAPDKVPDTTRNFGAQNQQVAQEKPSLDQHNDHPAIKGQTEIKTTQIVTGELRPPTPPHQQTPPEVQTPPQKAPAPVLREQDPIGGFMKDLGEAKDSVGSNIAKVPEHVDKVEKPVEGQKDVPLIDNAFSSIRIDPKRPQPRPTLDSNAKRARPAIFTDNQIGTTNIGPTAVDARWSNYGQYLQQLIETVQIQWERILTQSNVYPPSGTKVSVKFVLNKKGEISRILNVDGDAGDQGKRACASAITARAPYGPWTDDMVAMLGDEQEMTFTFFYQ